MVPVMIFSRGRDEWHCPRAAALRVIFTRENPCHPAATVARLLRIVTTRNSPSYRSRRPAIVLYGVASAIVGRKLGAPRARRYKRSVLCYKHELEANQSRVKTDRTDGRGRCTVVHVGSEKKEKSPSASRRADIATRTRRTTSERSSESSPRTDFSPWFFREKSERARRRFAGKETTDQWSEYVGSISICLEQAHGTSTTSVALSVFDTGEINLAKRQHTHTHT